MRAAFERANKNLSDDVLKTTLEDKALRHRKLIENDLPLFPGVVTFLKAASRAYSLGLVSMAGSERLATFWIASNCVVCFQ